MTSLLEVYHRLPPRMQSVVATGRGLWLRCWRYGADTERLVEEALERDGWTAERWEAWQGERLEELLSIAAERVPWYREHWAERRRRGDRASPRHLENWPVVPKKVLRENPRAFVVSGAPPRLSFRSETSGSTGTPLQVWWSRGDLVRSYALFEARCRRWYGVSRRDRWAILGGQVVTPVGKREPPFWIWNAALNQLYLSGYHLSARTVGDYLRALERYGVTYLLGYPSSMNALAQLAHDQGLRHPGLKVAISNAEPLFELQREAIGSFFSCPVRDTYGMTEGVCAASECEHGTLHLWPDQGIAEVFSGEGTEPCPAGEAGRLVATGLVNRLMPLVRYDIGDRVALGAAGAACACGRSARPLLAVEGRSDDVLVTRDGRVVGRLGLVFKADLRIREAQIVQEAPDFLRVLVAPAPGYGSEDERRIRGSLAQRLGDVRVEFQRVDEIPRGRNGKFKAVVRRARA